jgi:hypothetical protein
MLMTAFQQVIGQKADTLKNHSGVVNNDFKKRIEKQQEEDFEKVKKFSLTQGVPIESRDSFGNLVLLVGVDDFGLPQYITTDNVGAALTSGANQVVANYGVEGEGIAVGIWDGGAVGHSEFGSRILNSPQGAADVHANHVTGTILASGINPLAKGMAPKASAYSYDFATDLSEMISLASTVEGTLLSNHSYGLITGWRFDNGWTWFGNSAISTLEDFRFGFYSSSAASWDQLAINFPNYLIIKSAGNDRTDVGNGTRPADCNEGTGYDCISDISVAKNILTVGASAKVANYVDAGSVGMSSFSSWGPTDDGRIKPDLSAAGVNLFSTSTNNAYTTLSGTSMATPSVTGSLALLLELYKKKNPAKTLTASSLKALAIHTVKEAGNEVGPDYRFGWGLLDVTAAASFINSENGINKVIKEQTLQQGETQTFSINPKSNSIVKVTIVWTDPAGTPVQASLDPGNLMLVNDLDVRIHDDFSAKAFPWILNPAKVDAPATKGDNIRDNVEKIEFNNPNPRPYYVVVSHKGTLQGGSQKYSMIIEYEPDIKSSTAYFWIGGSGSWNNSQHWSLSSGGEPLSVLPTDFEKVIFDENSFSSNQTNNTIELTGDVSCGTFVWLSDNDVKMTFNSHSLTITEDMLVLVNSLIVDEQAKINFNNETNSLSEVNFGSIEMPMVELAFNGQGEWVIKNAKKIRAININGGFIRLNGNDFELSSLGVNQNSSLDISGSKLNQIIELKLNNQSFELISDEMSELNFSTSVNSFVELPPSIFGGTIETSLSTTFASNINCRAITASGNITFKQNATVGNLTLLGGSVLKLSEGKAVDVLDDILIESSAIAPVQLQSEGPGAAMINLNDRVKLCFDNLIIDRVNLTGQAVVSAGGNSTLSNSLGWSSQPCSEVLFPFFEVRYNCVNSITTFIDKSEGNQVEYIWDFGDPLVNNINLEDPKNPRVIYTTTGERVVKLTIKNGTNTSTYESNISVGPNPLPEPAIVNNSGLLINSIAGFPSQWYVNYTPIDGATARIFDPENYFGSFVVAISNDNCSRASSPYVIASYEDKREVEDNLFYPNPTEGVLFFNESQDFEKIIIINTIGVQLTTIPIDKDDRMIDLSAFDLNPGIYTLIIDLKNKQRVTRKVLLIR